MSQLRIDKQKAVNKWAPIFNNLGVVNEDKVEWMSEMAEFQSINENAYVNASNVAGMGGVISAQPSTLSGALNGNSWSGNGGSMGSGDIGQNMLPVSMKIAAQTIGLDLVAVKPSPGPKIDLVYIDFQYDDTTMGDESERPQVIKFSSIDATVMEAVIAAGNAALATNNIMERVGGLTAPLWATIDNTTNPGSTPAEPVGSKENYVQFLGFSRIDGYPMFRVYRQWNTAQTAITSATATWQFDQTRNTFGPTGSMASQITGIYFQGASGPVATPIANNKIELVSALEDHIEGFVSNWKQNGLYPMDRQMDDESYAGVIGPKMFTKSIAIGTIQVSSALRRTEIEDIKSNTGIDIVQKMESILVNELSQTISKQIVARIFEMGDMNRQTAPRVATPTINAQTIFDLDTDYVTSGPGGETTHAVQRKLITKMVHASNYIATDGRIGPAQFAVTNGGIAAALMDIAGYTINPTKSKMNTQGQLYPVGQIGDITIYVDPYQKYNDNRIVIGRKNNADQPGVIFIPYLMAQSISIISEATFAPRLLLRSRYVVADVGFFPQKQYMTIYVKDTGGYLN